MYTEQWKEVMKQAVLQFVSSEKLLNKTKNLKSKYIFVEYKN